MPVPASHAPRRASPRRILILAAAPAQLLDIAGPAEVLSQANRLWAADHGGPALYDVSCHIVPEPGSAATSAGLAIGSDVDGAQLAAWTDLDTLIIAGGEGARRRADEAPLRDLARDLAGKAARVVGICTGAFILGGAGCLRGRSVTTHWRWCAELGRRHPSLAVDPEPIFIQDGNVWTSAGITAGMDLTLALVEADHGHGLALSIARELVMFLRRPGGQKQFSTVLSAQAGLSVRLADLVAWMGANLHRPLCVEDLAARVGLSPRQFARAFQAEVGTTPARMLETLRVETARRLLESERANVSAVARLCGFRADETMRRAFLRHVGVPPGDYRDRFRCTSSPIHPASQEVRHA
ncbi:GlxA family transcriptional regulator [Methylobacterium goesingense]|uniref:Transcriptional regulator GlxA family with amidase domain n=1 Tax=Methylobacterium goesingense TaxID=243690 RepID=A0ABV2LF97_9HYPH|nr:helix-turn-helix domain-containing protein [Methylobacterium goesingense]GJD76348.1 HTH-type transcriptional activator RhaS [Methylobacterium goesingense]